MKNRALLFAAVMLFVLAGYLTFSRGCKEDPMRVSAVLRPARKGTATQRGVIPMYDVAFGFNKKYKLTSLKVVAAEDLATNKHPVVLWHMIAGSNSVPVNAVMYGKPVPGMRPAVADLEAEVLQPNIEYVVLAEAGRTHARTNFIARERPVR